MRLAMAAVRVSPIGFARRAPISKHTRDLSLLPTHIAFSRGCGDLTLLRRQNDRPRSDRSRRPLARAASNASNTHRTSNLQATDLFYSIFLPLSNRAAADALEAHARARNATADMARATAVMGGAVAESSSSAAPPPEDVLVLELPAMGIDLGELGLGTPRRQAAAAPARRRDRLRRRQQQRQPFRRRLERQQRR